MATTRKYDLIRVGQIGIQYLLESADTGGAVAMFEFTVPAGAKVPMPHFHKDFDETVYGLAGVLTMTVDGRSFDMAPGDSCFIPRGMVHGFNNLQSQEAKALAIITPALLGSAFFKDIAAVVASGGPPNVEAMKAVMLKHGLVPVMGK